jgi:type IX secretion system PorP/SprF family membrane protein
VVIINCLGIAYSQDLQLSQFYAAPLYLAPSFAGTADGLRVVANYRDQWPQVPDAYLTYMFSVDYNFAKYNSGAGFMVARDQKGELSYHTTNLGIYYSYDILIAHKVHVRPGLQFLYSLNGIDLSKLRMRDQIVLNTPTSNTIPVFESNNYSDAAISVLAYTEKFFLGSKIDHLFLPAQIPGGKESIPLKIDVFGGAKFRFHGKLLKPKSEYFMFAFNFRTMAIFSQLDLGLMGVIKSFQMGLWYRGIPVIKSNPGSDAVILSMGYIYRNVVFGYSHDFTISGLRSYSNGANEISLILLFDEVGHGKKKRTAIKCPEFY